MNRRGLCRPSLKITRSDDQTEAPRFRVEIWNPFLHRYQPTNSVEEGMARINALANLIGRMWIERHPKRDALKDVPEVAEIDGRCWAELRITATSLRSYDMRSGDHPAWARTAGMKDAATAICATVGYERLGAAAA